MSPSPLIRWPWLPANVRGNRLIQRKGVGRPKKGSIEQFAALLPITRAITAKALHAAAKKHLGISGRTTLHYRITALIKAGIVRRWYSDCGCVHYSRVGGVA